MHRTAGALLHSRCYIKSFEGDTVEIGFQSQMLVEKALGDPAVLQAMCTAVGGVAGREVKVVPVVWEVLQSAAPPRAAAPAAPPPGGAPPPAGPPPAGPPAAAPPAERGGHLFEEARRLGAVPVEE